MKRLHTRIRRLEALLGTGQAREFTACCLYPCTKEQWLATTIYQNGQAVMTVGEALKSGYTVRKSIPFAPATRARYEAIGRADWYDANPRAKALGEQAERWLKEIETW